MFSYGSSFYAGQVPDASSLQRRSELSPINAIKELAQAIGVTADFEQAVAEATPDKANAYTVHGTGLAQDPRAELAYLATENDEVVLSWRIRLEDGTDDVVAHVDANNATRIIDASSLGAHLATFQVYPLGVQDPSAGERQVLEDPWDNVASPYTWLGNGTFNYTSTTGNNVVAYYNNDVRPESPERKFEYPFLLDVASSNYRDAATVQAFYMVNTICDILYHLGFDETAGNFQVTNRNGAGKGNDPILIDVQARSEPDNAGMVTPEDGRSPRMKLGLFNRGNRRNRDTAFDSTVVVHEYGHGCKNGSVILCSLWAMG